MNNDSTTNETIKKSENKAIEMAITPNKYSVQSDVDNKLDDEWRGRCSGS